MKKTLLSLFCIAFYGESLFSQSAFTWEKTYGGLWYETGYSVDQTFDGGLVIAGYAWSNDGDVKGHHGSVGDPDAWILKLNANGDTVWTRSLGGTRSEYANRIIETPDSGFIVAAQAGSTDGDVWDHHGAIWYDDMWIVKLDNMGDTVWTKSYGGTDDDYAYSIDLTSDGGYIIGGTSYSADGDVWDHIGSWDYWIVRINSAGDTLWTNSFGGTSSDYLESIKTTDDGGCIAAGWTYSTDGDVTGNHGGKDAWVIKLDSAGVLQWQKALGGLWWDYAFSVDLTNDGNYIVAGSSESTDGDVWGNKGWFDFWVVKLNTAGDTLWTRSYGGTKDDIARSIKTTCDGGYILTGNSNSNDGNVSGHHGSTDSLDAWILKIDSIGTVEWQMSLGGTRPDEFYNINETDDGYFLATGYSKSVDGDVSVNKGLNDLWVVKMKVNRVKPEICLVTVDSVSGKNQVVWEEILYPAVSYNIYKEGIIANQYNLVGNVPKDSLSVFDDLASNPNVKSNRYVISTVDSCGFESDTSGFHKTIHLTANMDINDQVNLVWDNYEGLNFSTYYIYRNIGAGWDSIDAVPNNLITYTDTNTLIINANPTLFYQISVVHPWGCTADKVKNYNSSKSNTSSVTNTGVLEIGNGKDALHIFPNPSGGEFILRITNNEQRIMKYEIKIYNVLGQQIYQSANPPMTTDLMTIDLSDRPAGIYQLQVITRAGTVNGKLVIE